MTVNDERADRISRLLYLGIGGVMLAFGAYDLGAGVYLLGSTYVIQGGVWLSFLAQRRVWIGFGKRRADAEFFERATEASERGLTLNQWIIAEVERHVGEPITTRGKP